MLADIKRLIGELESLELIFENLATHLFEESNLVKAGLPPSEDLIIEIKQGRDAFASLREEVLKLVPGGSAQPYNTLPELRDQLFSLKDNVSKRDLYDRAIVAAQRVLRLVHVNGEDFEPLTSVKSLAAEVIGRLQKYQDDDYEEARELIEGRHHFSQLLLLVERGDELEDATWSEAFSVVRQEFGPALAGAVGKRHVVFSEVTSGVLPIIERETSAVGAEDGSDFRSMTKAVDHTSELDSPSQHEATSQLPAEPATGDTELTQKPSEEAIVTLPRTKGESEESALESIPHGELDKEKPAVTFPLPIAKESEEATAAAASSSASAANDAAAFNDNSTAATAAASNAVDASNAISALSTATASRGETAIQALPPKAETARSSPSPEGHLMLVWQLLSEGRVALAFHLSNELARRLPPHPLKAEDRELPLPPPGLLRALALAPYLYFPGDSIALTLKESFDRLDLAFEDPVNQLLLWAATFRPALLDPNTGATGLMRTLRLGHGLSNIYALTQEMVSVSERLQGLDLSVIHPVRESTAWQSEMEQLINEVMAWRDIQAPSMSYLYAPATAVWKVLIRPDGHLGRIVKAIVENEKGSVKEVARAIEDLSDPASLRRIIDEIDRKEIGRRKGEPIHARAFSQLKKHAEEAVEFARRWLRLQERPVEQPGYILDQVKRLQAILASSYDRVRSELQSYESLNTNLPHRAAVRCCLRSLDDVKQLFDPKAPLPARGKDVRHVLGAELLLCPDLELDENWCPQTTGEPFLLSMQKLATEPQDWREAFKKHLVLGTLDGAERILDYLDSIAYPEIAELRGAFKQAFLEHQSALMDDIVATRREIEQDLTLGLINEGERALYDAIIVDYERRLDTIRRFKAAHGALLDIRNQLSEQRKRKTAQLWQELQELNLESDDESYLRISKAIDSGDLLSANEYVARVKAGETLIPPKEDPPDLFEAFFPEGAQKIEEFLDEHNWQVVINQVKKQKSFAGLSMREVPGAQADQAADMLEAWAGLKKVQQVRYDEMRRILRGLGFHNVKPDIKKAAPPGEVLFETDPITDRKICPVPFFGSDTGGIYRVLCVWGRPSEEELLNLVGETAQQQHATLVFYFGRLTEKRRRDLARISRERRRTFLVIDELLLVFLSAQRGHRLPALFRCTLPFTFVEPYVTTSGLVPPEMFYGRKMELDSLVDFRNGQSFVYGGRQLGKTALLRQAARSFRNPAQGRFAAWIDLRAEGIGYDREPEEIWRVLAREFARLGVLSPDVPDPNPKVKGRVARFKETILKWFESHPEYRILVLLDEADRFLEQDGRRSFQESSSLKGLMDRTDRRFKIVFAGLHNVLRTTEQSNHPLAHLGDPINIGPLLRNGEWHEARELIVYPLKSIGYRFESNDLVTRIMAQTNYYPSLIQLYGAQLLRQLTNPQIASLDFRSGPPYIITERHVMEAYQSQELRDAIRQRFQLTLQLDPRYEVIAYLIAYHFLLEEGSAAKGLGVREIKEMALSWWHEGFKGVSDIEFGILLQEMEGLGVLRSTNESGGTFYTLRSPNVLLLMGTLEEIERVLEKDREAPQIFEPAIFRAGKRGGPSPVRHPLTFQQEALLSKSSHGVTLITGTKAAGLDQLVSFIQERSAPEFLRILDRVTNRRELELELNTIDKRSPGGTTLIVIPEWVPWGEEWISLAIDKVKRFRSDDRNVRIVFVGDPKTLWWLVSPWKGVRGGIDVIGLGPWHDGFLRQWLEEVEAPRTDPDMRRRIAQVTGNWSYLLLHLYQRTRQDHRWDHQLELLEQWMGSQEGLSELLPAFGLDVEEPRRALEAISETTGGEILETDLSDLSEMYDIPLEILSRSLYWAELLGLVIPVGPKNWRLEGVARRLLGG